MNETKKFNRYSQLELFQPIQLPETSRLYSLKPIGLEMPFIESLSSYLLRLATEHCVTPKKLIMGEIAPLIMGNQYAPEMLSKNASTLFGNSDAKPAINGMRDMRRSLVDALEQLTLRQDLRYLSCLTYQGVIKDRSLFRQNKAWCPECFEEWQQENKPIYEPLLWSFKDVNYCPNHNCQLSDRCLGCDSLQKAIANHSRLGYCDRCKKWLGNNLDNELEIAEKERQVITGIGELIATAPILYSSPTLPDMIQKLKLIQFSFERSLRQDLTQFIALGKVLEQLKIVISQHSDQPLNLVGLLIPVCSLAKISIGQLFGEDVSTLGTMMGINLL